MNLFFIFLTGLTSGGLSCLAMQGGLLASVIANQKKQETREAQPTKALQKNLQWSSFDQLDWMPVGMFLVSKLLAHTILGFVLGGLGSVVTLSLGWRLFFQSLAAFFMFATAMNLLEAHPIFRYISFQPPAFMQRWVRRTSKSQALFAPALLGLLTIFVPCGVTQAMEVVAMTSGQPITGALIMAVFVLGTSPLFALVGLATAKFSEAWSRRFSQVAALSLVLMTLYSLNGVLVVLDAPVTVQKVVRSVNYFFSDERYQPTSDQTVDSGVQSVTIRVLNGGYQPNRFQVKRGQPVELTLKTKDTYSCAVDFVFKEFGIETFLGPNDTQTFTFTPTKPGRYQFSCSMGMYTGVMEVL